MSAAKVSQPGPRGFLTCHVCQRRVSRHSIMFHVPKCLERHQAHIDGVSRNKRAGAPRKVKKKEDQPVDCAEPPNLVSCYVCHRKVGRHSLEFHESKCLLRWEAQNNLLPEGKRQKPPQKVITTSSEILNAGSECFQTNGSSAVSKAVMMTITRPDKLPTGTFILEPGYNIERPRTQTLIQRSNDVKRPMIGIGNLRKRSVGSSCVNLNVHSNSHNNAVQNCKNAKCKLSKNSSTSQFQPKLPLEIPNEKQNPENSCSNLTKQSNLKTPKCISEESGTTEKDMPTNDTVGEHNANSIPSVPLKTKESRTAQSKYSKEALHLEGDTLNIPKFIICYICEKRFATRCFLIHEPRCMERWNLKNNSLPVQERKPTPKRCLSSADCFQCRACLKVFPPERFLIHRDICSSTGSVVISKEKDRARKSKSETENLKYIVSLCRICGRHYGSLSINIHERQCIKKWETLKETYPVKVAKLQKRTVSTEEVCASFESLTLKKENLDDSVK